MISPAARFTFTTPIGPAVASSSPRFGTAGVVSGVAEGRPSDSVASGVNMRFVIVTGPAVPAVGITTTLSESAARETTVYASPFEVKVLVGRNLKLTGAVMVIG